MHCQSYFFNKVISPDNVWLAWLKYRRGKNNRQEVRGFERFLEENLLEIIKDLKTGTYKHGGYRKFVVEDPKKRIISAPTIRDHIVHQAVYNILYPHFEKSFSPFSFSCRKNFGTHRAIEAISKYFLRGSLNYRKKCWILHGDIEKCFDSINQRILCELLNLRIPCQRTIKLLKIIIESYDAGKRYDIFDFEKRGIPLGNLTSQLFVNVYLDQLDGFVKEQLKAKNYVRYADDFLIIESKKGKCEEHAEKIRKFLKIKLDINFPQDHQRISRITQGIEVLGMKFLPFYRKSRQSTINRSYKLFRKKCLLFVDEKITAQKLNSSWQSIRGMLKWGYNFKSRDKFINFVSLYGSNFYVR